MEKREISRSDYDKIMAELERAERAFRSLHSCMPHHEFHEFLSKLCNLRIEVKEGLKVVKGKRSEIL
jgi:hypothetical protein